MQKDTPIDPSQAYAQSVDKQRVVITGAQSRLIAGIVIYVLDANKRQYDFITQVPLSGKTSTSRLSDAPLIVIQENETPAATILDYHHHIGVISDIGATDERIATRFADATPKGGILIYADTNPAGSIGKKERPDTTGIPYKAYHHALENGQVKLITTKNERVPIKLNGDVNLRSLSAAREILKKTGITSEQFYSAITSFVA